MGIQREKIPKRQEGPVSLITPPILPAATALTASEPDSLLAVTIAEYLMTRHETTLPSHI
jgi:hypothetical protein